MLHNLEIRPKALLDAQSATDYYDAINVHLGDRFEDELHLTYKKITVNPQFYKYLSKKGSKQLRFTKLKSFPYIVIFKIDVSAVVVISVFNTHRKPHYT